MRVGATEIVFETRDHHARMAGKTLGGGDALGQGCELGMPLRGFSGVTIQPDAIEATAPQRRFGDREVALVRRIEGAAHKADSLPRPHARRLDRQEM